MTPWLGITLSLIAAALSASTGSAVRERVSTPATRPVRVMSMNQCTDQLVLALLPPERIASVSWLSRDPELSLLHEAAMRVGVNHGQAEEAIRQKPDLVITGAYSTPTTRALLKRLGYPVVEVAEASSFAEIAATTRQIARAVGEEARGEALIARMQGDLRALSRAPVQPVRVAAWSGSGFSASRGSLYDAVLTTAGAINIGTLPPAAAYGSPDTEVLVAAAPVLLVQSARVRPEPGLRDNVARHPVVRRYWGTERVVTIRPSDFMCGTPFIGDAIRRLRAQLQRVPAAARSPVAFATVRQ